MKRADITILAGVGLAAFILSNIRDVTAISVKLLYPIYGKITSAFGNRIHPITRVQTFHNGVDIAGKIGDKVKCPLNGVVSNVYSNSTGGNQLIIQHSNGFVTGYAHLNKIFVSVGAKVLQGQVVAEVGNTGQSTGPHLHFTLKNKQGNFVDPLQYLV